MDRPMIRPTVLFDLDGTLIDTAPDLVASLNHAIATIGLEPVGQGDVGHLVGHGARAMIAKAATLHGRRFDVGETDGLLAALLAHYLNTMPGQSRPYPGVRPALERLAEAGIAVAICTNKPVRLATILIERLGLDRHFSAIAGGDSFAVRKPEAGHLIGTLGLAGGHADAAVMVGDSVNDIEAARRAGLPSIAVSFGYSDVPVVRLKPTRVIDHFDALTPELVSALTGGRHISGPRPEAAAVSRRV